MNKSLLILDLDETLIHSKEKEDFNHEIDVYDFIIDSTIFVKKRPYVDQFIQSVSQHFELAVWTAATRGYANEIVKEVIDKNNVKLNFINCRENCTPKYYSEGIYGTESDFFHLKNLNKLKKIYNLDKVIMVDDFPKSLQNNYGNLIRVKPFIGDNHDVELLTLEKYLISIKDENNLRKLEKRNWLINNNITKNKM